MLNDPKYDHYPIPRELLKYARKKIKKGATREQVAAELVRILEACVERDPRTRDNIALLELNTVQQHIMIEERLRMADPSCEESKDYRILLNRLRSRKHDVKRKLPTEEELVERRKKHNAYMRERRKDPKVRARLREGAAKAYRDRKENDPEGHERYLAEKRAQRKIDMQDPVKRARIKAHAKKNQVERSKRYHSDPEYREECRAYARAQYNARRARGYRRKKKKKEA